MYFMCWFERFNEGFLFLFNEKMFISCFWGGSSDWSRLRKNYADFDLNRSGEVYPLSSCGSAKVIDKIWSVIFNGFQYNLFNQTGVERQKLRTDSSQ